MASLASQIILEIQNFCTSAAQQAESHYELQTLLSNMQLFSNTIELALPEIDALEEFKIVNLHCYLRKFRYLISKIFETNNAELKKRLAEIDSIIQLFDALTLQIAN